MMKRNVWVAAALVVAAAGSFAAWQVRVAAGSARPALEVTFGPIQVEGSSRATFFLALRNTGGGDSKLALGDEIEIGYGTGGGAGDLLAVNQQIVAGMLPAGIALQRITDTTGHETGIRLAVQGTVTIAAGGAQVLTFDGATAAPGGAPVRLSLKLSKAAGRAPRRLSLAVVKTPPTSGAGFYGDGSDGPLDVAFDTQIEPLRNYTDVLIRTGVTVTVPSGSTIRCTGTFENRGTIRVLPGSPGAGRLNATTNLAAQVEPPLTQAERGDSFAAPEVPAALFQAPVTGAKGGVGIGVAVQALPLSYYRRGGGGGSGTLGAIGGDGGGLVRVLARGPVYNGGLIESRGGTPTINRTGIGGGAGGGAGGGGGGIGILASGTSVDNGAPANANGAVASGTVDVTGGSATTADPSGGGGGGGGGGLAIFCAPAVPTNGTIGLFGGLSAFQTFATGSTIWAGGGGGGACVGNGGDGSPVRAGGIVGPVPGGVSDPPTATPGLLVIRLADPRTLWQ